MISRLARGREWSRAAKGGSRAAVEAAGHRPHGPGTPQAPPCPRGTAHSPPAPPQAPPSKNRFFFSRYDHRAWPNLRSGLVCETFEKSTFFKHSGLCCLEIDTSLPAQFSRRIWTLRQFLMVLASGFLKNDSVVMEKTNF